MRRRHFELLEPVCPACLRATRETPPLSLARVDREADDIVFEGALACINTECRLEFPIIDGIPFVVPQFGAMVTDQALALLGRNDLSPLTESLVGDALGADSAFNVIRQHLSSYAWDHYGDLTGIALAGAPSDPSTIARCLERGLTMLTSTPAPILDLGCSVGRTTFELAARTAPSNGLVLGVDLNVAMLRLAQRALREGRISFPLRRIGLVYDRCSADVMFAGNDRVDFWACDALALPFPPGRFQTVVALNLLDSIPDPYGLLRAMRGALAVGGQALFGAPYDWGVHVTSPEAWLGGHSQRGEGEGRAEPLVRSLLTPGAHPAGIAGLRLTNEATEVPWYVRSHDRSTVAYLVHLVAALRDRPVAGM